MPPYHINSQALGQFLQTVTQQFKITKPVISGYDLVSEVCEKTLEHGTTDNYFALRQKLDMINADLVSVLGTNIALTYKDCRYGAIFAMTLAVLINKFQSECNVTCLANANFVGFNDMLPYAGGVTEQLCIMEPRIDLLSVVCLNELFKQHYMGLPFEIEQAYITADSEIIELQRKNNDMQLLYAQQVKKLNRMFWQWDYKSAHQTEPTKSHEQLKGFVNFLFNIGDIEFYELFVTTLGGLTSIRSILEAMPDFDVDLAKEMVRYMLLVSTEDNDKDVENMIGGGFYGSVDPFTKQKFKTTLRIEPRKLELVKQIKGTVPA